MENPRLLIIDDEPLARERVRSFLRDETALEIIGECGSGSEALVTIKRDRPDIVLLDMQMPGCNGLEVAADLPADNRPAIIFVTGHDRYAVEAFAVQAVDYVLKPFDRERLQLALKRAVNYIQLRRESALNARVESLLASRAPREQGRLAFKTEGRVVFLKARDIVWVEASNNHSVLHLADSQQLLLRETLSSIEERLGPVNFTRVNRSALVCLDQVSELQPANYGDYTVVLQNGRRLPLSRNLRGSLEKFIVDEK